jgi:hypothetical protein
LGSSTLFNEQLEAIMAKVIEILESIPGTAEMLSITGIGLILITILLKMIILTLLTVKGITLKRRMEMFIIIFRIFST